MDQKGGKEVEIKALMRNILMIEAAGLGNLMKGKGDMESEIHIRIVSNKRDVRRKNCFGENKSLGLQQDNVQKAIGNF